MKVSIKNMAHAIYEGAKDKSGDKLDLFLSNVLIQLRKNKLLNKKNKILESLQEIIDKEENVLRVKITSADELSDKQKEDIGEKLKDRYKKDNIIIDKEIDKNLISGFIIQKDDEVLDYTLAHKLHQLQKHLNTK